MTPTAADLMQDPDVDQVIGYPDKTMVVLDADVYLRLKAEAARLERLNSMKYDTKHLTMAVRALRTMGHESAPDWADEAETELRRLVGYELHFDEAIKQRDTAETTIAALTARNAELEAALEQSRREFDDIDALLDVYSPMVKSAITVACDQRDALAALLKKDAPE